MKKFLSLILTLAMVLSLVTVPAFATDPVAVTNITVSGTESITRGATATQLTAAVTPNDATNKNVTWTSSNPAVATVSSNGEVTGLKAGTATITATSVSEPNVKGTLEVTVTDALLESDFTSITVNGRTYSGTAAFLLPGESTLTAGNCTAELKNGRTCASMSLSGDNITVTDNASETLVIHATRLADSITVNANTTIVTGGSVDLAATYTGDPQTKYNWTYVPAGGSATEIVSNQAGKTYTWTPSLSVGAYEVTCTAKIGNTTVATGSFTLTVEADVYALAPANQNSVLKGATVSRSAYVTFTTNGAGDTFASLSNPTFTIASGSTVISKDSNGTVTALDDGTATLTVSGKYKGKTYSTTVSFTVKSMSYTLDPVENGDYISVDYYTMKSGAVSAIKNVNTYSTLTESDITSMVVTSISNVHGELYNDSYSSSYQISTTQNTNILDKGVYYKATSGFVGTATFVVKVNGTYDVTFKVPVNPIETTFADQYAGSATSYTVSIPSGYTQYWVVAKNPSTAPTDYTSYNSTTAYSSTRSLTLTSSDFSAGECVLYIVAKETSTNKLYCGSLTVVQEFIEYSGVINKDIYFDEDDFDEFVDDAAGITSKSKASVELVNVVFTKPSSSYVTLYDNGTKITDSKTKCTDLDKVYLTATKTGTYDLSFTANAKYYSGSTVTTGTAKEYKGVVRVTVYKDGDIKYEVDAGKTVTFNEEDFNKFLPSTKGTLSYVTFDKPSDGELYEDTRCRYDADTTTKYYFEATGSQDDLDTVTFEADKTPLTEYSVYIPFHAKGTKGAVEDGVVEIIVNGSMPFTDVPESNTFYEYIKYCYRENIMQGKSTTLFKPTEPVTRAQLVVTLYRMANSPTTYNSNTMSFTDCKTLSTEFQNAIKWGVAKKLINGYGNTFKPNDSITRQAMVTILYRFGTNLGYIDGYGVTGSLNRFSDAAKISASMKDAVAWAVGAGLVSGNNGKFNPAGTTTRGACAKILAGFHETYVG